MERYYENLVGEMDANIDIMDDNMGEGVRYGTDLQIVQENSKRFLCVYPSDRVEVNKHFNQGYLDNECYSLGFSNYPSEGTHFRIQPCCSFQSEGEAIIRKDHFFHLVHVTKQGREFSLFNIGKNIFFTESYK